MAEIINTILAALMQLWVQILLFVPKVIIALVIWVIGKYLIKLAVTLIRKVDIKGIKLDNYLTEVFSRIILIVGKILLFLIILDYLDIAKTVVGAVAAGLTLTIAIALGLSFGKALEGDAKEIVDKLKGHLGKK